MLNRGASVLKVASTAQPAHFENNKTIAIDLFSLLTLRVR